MITKRYRKLLTGLVLFTIHCSLFTLFLASCSDDNEPARTPSLQANVSKTNLEINESMEIHFTGVADQIVVSQETRTTSMNGAIRATQDLPSTKDCSLIATIRQARFTWSASPVHTTLI